MCGRISQATPGAAPEHIRPEGRRTASGALETPMSAAPLITFAALAAAAGGWLVWRLGVGLADALRRALRP